jgi:hypothetical protein
MCDYDNDGVNNLEQWGYGAHTVLVTDIPDDQGGRLHLQFNSSFYDTDSLSRSEVYTIERKDGDIWMVVQSFGAYGAEQYNVEVNTLYNNIPTEFRVIANMEEGNYVTYEPIEGTSLDNIHPTSPSLMSAEHEDMDVSLNWQYELEEDFAYHRITSLNSIDNIISNEYSFTLNDHDEHWVTSVDIHGNLSGNTLSTMSMVLEAGANLRSFNVLPEDNSITNVMASVEGIATVVVGEGVAASYQEGVGWLGSLSSIQVKSGYWIIVSEDDVLLLTGVPTSRDIEYILETDANLISYPFRYASVSKIYSISLEVGTPVRRSTSSSDTIIQ